MYSPVLPSIATHNCTAMCSHVLPCMPMYHHVLTCIPMYYHVLPRVAMYYPEYNV